MFLKNKNYMLLVCCHTQNWEHSEFQRLWFASTFLHPNYRVASNFHTAHTV